MKIVTLGEIMLRLCPEGYLRFVQADKFEASFGGGEANVAVSLANFGEQAVFVSALPSHELGQAAVNSLRRYGVDTSKIIRKGDRIGIYYLEKGASQRPSKVVYDRACSAFAESTAQDFDWEEIFNGADWFHFTGITPALGDDAAQITKQAVECAKHKGLSVSCDLNYRKKLWSKEKSRSVMANYMPYVDLLIANEDDASDVFRIRAADTDTSSGKLSRAGYEDVARQLSALFGIGRVAITLRQSLSASDNKWGALLFNGKDCLFSKTYDVHIVDRVGGGDSFAAGLIYALSNGKSDFDAIEWAAAASCLKHTVEGDFNLATVAEIDALVKGDGSGRVQR